MKKRGFSVVELAIVIALIGILSLIVFVSLRNNQVAARDSERHAKAESIARSLEILYKAGNQSAGGTFAPGSYPSMHDIDQPDVLKLLPSIDEATLTFSWKEGGASVLKSLESTGANMSYHNTEDMDVEAPRVGQDEFIYVPYSIMTNATTVMPPDVDGWKYCTLPGSDDCRRFNIYYRTEADNELHIIRSTYQ